MVYVWCYNQHKSDRKIPVSMTKPLSVKYCILLNFFHTTLWCNWNYYFCTDVKLRGECLRQDLLLMIYESYFCWRKIPKPTFTFGSGWIFDFCQSLVSGEDDDKVEWLTDRYLWILKLLLGMKKCMYVSPPSKQWIFFL